MTCKKCNGHWMCADGFDDPCGGGGGFKRLGYFKADQVGFYEVAEYSHKVRIEYIGTDEPPKSDDEVISDKA